MQGAIAYARGVVVKLLRNEVPIEDLTMSKQLTRKPEDYKNPMPHTVLAKRLQATQPAHIVAKTGYRIPFLIPKKMTRTRFMPATDQWHK